MTLVPVHVHRFQEHPISFHLREEPSLNLQELNLRSAFWNAAKWWVPKKFKSTAVTLSSENKTFDDRFYMTTQQLIENAGYGFAEHHVTTDDGYNLTMFQIMNAQVQAGVHQPAVFFQHGLMDTSHSWVS